MKFNKSFFILINLFFMCVSMDLNADDTWKSRAHLQVQQPGIIESVFPLELTEQISSNAYDLTLLGPDDKPRAFELFWTEPDRKVSANLSPVNFAFKKNQAFEWIGNADTKIKADTIFIRIDEADFISKVDVAGFNDNQWLILRKNETIYKTNDQSRMELSITPGVYERIRIEFTGFNPKYEKKFAPISLVQLMGIKPGKEHIQQTRTLKFKQIQTANELEVRAILPGSGLMIQSVNFSTQAQFQGFWKVGFETIQNGRQVFVQVKKGRISYVSGTKQSVSIDLKQKWQGRTLILKLDSNVTHIGEILDLTAIFLVPRFIFSADITGKYTAITGKNHSIRIFQHPGDITRSVDQILEFANPEQNQAWHPELLVEKFQIKGGPFDKKGYTWNSLLEIAKPGYYRLILNQKTSHEKNRSIRIVKDDVQIPFFFGNNELKEIDLTAYMKTDYNPDKNQTQIHVKLPYASEHWSHLVFQSKGIFKRLIQLEIPKPGNMGWNSWIQKNWSNETAGKTLLKLSMRPFPSDCNEFKITINHEDNSPIVIERANAAFTSPTILFLAHAPGNYAIYGGNTDAKPPSYDLSLVKSLLLEQVPVDLTMTETQQLKPDSFKHDLLALFQAKTWGLYFTLGLVTLILLILIYKLFPKPEP